METYYIKDNVNDITYKSELILGILKCLDISKMSRIKFADAVSQLTKQLQFTECNDVNCLLI